LIIDSDRGQDSTILGVHILSKPKPDHLRPNWEIDGCHDSVAGITGVVIGDAADERGQEIGLEIHIIAIRCEFTVLPSEIERTAQSAGECFGKKRADEEGGSQFSWEDHLAKNPDIDTVGT
jgi:hypothetical protein